MPSRTRRNNNVFNRQVRQRTDGNVIDQRSRNVLSRRNTTVAYSYDVNYCMNCRRHSGSGPISGCSPLNLSVVSIDKHSRVLKFCRISPEMFRKNKTSDGVLKICCCGVCSNYFRAARTGGKKYNENWKLVWPSFYWGVLSSPSVMERVGVKIWGIVPQAWRPWWLEEFQKFHGGICSDVSLHCPRSIVRDITEKVEFADGLRSRLKLFEIEKHWCKVLECKVLCPWGCCEFVHKTAPIAESIPLDILLARALDLTDVDMKFVTPRPGYRMMDQLRGIREDYLTFPMNNHQVHVLNNPSPEWEILPSLKFYDGEPRGVVCRDCCGGSSKYFLYPPRLPFAMFPSPRGELLSPAAVRSRILKTARASMYSDRHQMLHLQGHINGVDCIRVTNDFDFSQESQMSGPFQSLSLLGREEIRAHVNAFFCTDDGIPSTIGDELLHQSQLLGPVEAYSEFYESATYITAGTALQLEVEGKNSRKPCVTRPVEGQGERTHSNHFTPTWPRIVPYVHTYNEYGCRLPPLYLVRGVCDPANRGMWIVFGVISYIQEVYQMFSMKDDYDVTDINGFLLTQVSKCCFPHLSRRMGKDYPFKFGEKGTTELQSLQKLVQSKEVDVVDCGSLLCHLSSNTGQIQQYLLPTELCDMETLIQHTSAIESAECCCFSTSAIECVQYDIGEVASKYGWEMRFIAVCDDAMPTRIFARHGSTFKKWWVVSSNSSFVEKHREEHLPNFEGKAFLVFIRKLETSFTSMRESFLSSIGGQCKVFCASHKQPFIVHAKDIAKNTKRTAPTDDEELDEDCENLESCRPTHEAVTNMCSMKHTSKCSGYVSYCCPNMNCNHCLCSRHMRDASMCSKTADEHRVFIGSDGIQGSPVIGDVSQVVHYNRDGDDFEEAHIMVKQSSQDGPHTYNEQEDVFDFNAWDNMDATSFSSEHAADDGNDDDRSDNCSSSAAGRSRSASADTLNEMADGLPQNEFELTNLDEIPYDGNFAPARLDIDGNDAERFVAVGFFDYEDVIDDPVSSRPGNNGLNETGKDGEENITPRGYSTTASLWSPVACYFKKCITSVSGSVILNNCGTLLARGFRKLRPSTWQCNFVQRLVATTPGRSVPLLYAEGTLFPSIFWKDDNETGVLGAIPTALLACDKTLSDFGIAGVPKHLRNRMKAGPSSACAENNDYLCFAFDAMANLSCRGEDTRLVMRRGLGQYSPGLKKKDDSMMFDSESIESRPHVNQLCAKMRDEGATYFGSHSGNHRDHFGLKRIKEWIDSPHLYDLVLKSLEKFGCSETIHLERDIKDAIQKASTLIMLRHWQETTELYMDYICRSDEQPLGRVIHAWYRHEYQESAGNLSHLHFLLWIDRSEDINDTMRRIRGSYMDFITPDDLNQFIEEGMEVDDLDPFAINDLAEKFLTHLCSQRCLKRVSKDGELMCRVTNNGLENPNPQSHTLMEVDVTHSDAANDVLKDIGLIEKDGCNVSKKHDALRAFKHYPPGRAADGKVSACNSRLFAATKSNQNLTFVTGYFASRYVAKYSAKIDESNRVFIGAGQREKNSLSFDVQFLHNTKITGSKINEEKKMAKRSDKDHPTGRAISIIEMMQVCLGYDMVHTNIVFVHVSTKPLGERTGQNISPSIKADPTATRPEDLSSDKLLPTYVLRNAELRTSMMEWQKLAPSETILLRDMCFSNVSFDRISIFNVRPPELRFVRSLENYYKWFFRESVGVKGNLQKQLGTLRPLIKADVTKSAWVDGLGHRVYVRPGALEEVHKYINELEDDSSFYCADHTRPTNSRNVAKRYMLSVFRRLVRYTESMRCTIDRHSPLITGVTGLTERAAAMVELFLGPCAKLDASRKVVAIPVVWFDPVPPTQSHRFIVHLLLSMGTFDNELNLFSHGSMKECFQYAGLLPAGAHEETAVIDQCKDLLRRYILEQLVFQPAGTKQFDRFVVAAWETIKTAVISDELSYREMPSCLYTQLCRNVRTGEQTLINKTRSDLVNTVYDNMVNKGFVMPVTKEALIDATTSSQVDFDHAMVQGEGQSDASFKEQGEVLEEGKTRFQKYLSSTTASARGLIINGGPGTGKTTMMELLILYAQSHGLYSVLTAMMSERATQLGGVHISRLFCIPVRDSVSTGRLAEMAYLDLLKNSDRIAVLRKMDVLFVDEFGQVSAEMLATMDIIMRRIRNSTQFMGGVLVVATYDYLQLPPIKGRPPLLSPYILTSFLLRRLDHSVRAGKDKELQKIQEYTRLSPSKFAEVRSEFVRLVREYCTFVVDFDDPTVAVNTLRMFGKKSAARIAEEKLLKSMMQKHGSSMVSAVSNDLEAAVEGVFVQATTATSRRLNREVKEPRELWFYERALYELTYNKRNHFSQTQLAVLSVVPTAEHLADRRPIDVLLAPPGCKSLPSDDCKIDDLIAMGWKPSTVGVCPDRIQRFSNGIQAKRVQYGLKHRIAATIHSGMGQDLPGLITRVTSKEEDPVYHLWSKEQVIVLLSRTHYAKDIIFVGNAVDTANALADCLSHVSQYSDYMSHIMEVLTSPSTTVRTTLVDPFLYNPFRMCDYEIPNTIGSFCYNLVSLGDPTRGTSYIGETNNIAHRYAAHNQGRGAQTTRDIALIPWALLGFVTGFEDDTRAERMKFEALWQARRDGTQRSLHRQLRPDEVSGVAADIIRTVPQYSHLKYVRCGRVG